MLKLNILRFRKNITLTLFHKNEYIKKKLKNKTIGEKINFYTEKKPLGTGGAMRNCLKYITGTTAVFNGDVVSQWRHQLYMF